MPAAPDTSPPSPLPSGPEERPGVSMAKAFTIFVSVIGLVLLIGGGWWIYPYWEKSRADSFAADAEEALENHSFPEAKEEVQKALKMRPRDSRYLRLAGRIYAIDRDPQAIEYFQALLQTGEASEQDRYDFIELALLLKKPELAQQLVNQMTAGQAVSAKAQFYAALLAEARHDIPKAIELARAAIAQEPTRDHRLLLGRVLLASGDKEKIVEGKKILFDIASRSNRGRLRAIRALASTDLSPAELQQLIQWLKFTPMPALEDLFLGYDLLYRADTNNIEKLGQQVAVKFTSGRPEEQIALGAWLNSHRLYEQTLEYFAAAPDLKNARVTAIYLDALIGAQKWEEASKFAEQLERAGEKDEARAAYKRLATHVPAAAPAKAANLPGSNSAKTGSQ